MIVEYIKKILPAKCCCTINLVYNVSIIIIFYMYCISNCTGSAIINCLLDDGVGQISIMNNSVSR